MSVAAAYVAPTSSDRAGRRRRKGGPPLHFTQATVCVAEDAIAAYNRGDFEAVRELSHPDIELDWSASRGLEAGVYRGKDEVVGFYEAFVETFEEVRIVPDDFIASDEVVVVPNSARIRGRDGIEAFARSALLFRIEDGRVTGVCLFQETHEALEAAGLAEHAPQRRPRHGTAGL